MKKYFYLYFSIWSVITVFTGFWSGYFGKMLKGNFDIQPVIHIHAFIYLGWIALFFTQALKVLQKNIPSHKKWGRIGIYYGLAVFLMGLITTYFRHKFHIASGNPGQAQALLIFGIRDMLLFGVLFAVSMIYRKKSLIHKIWILAAATSLLVASVSRANDTFLGGNSFIFYLLWFLPVFMGALTEYQRKNPYWWHFIPIILIMLVFNLASIFFK